jgi:hypothetical protein
VIVSRALIVALLAWPLLADPIVCRAEAKADPCAATSRHLHESGTHGDACEGCLCQGATRLGDARSAPAADEAGAHLPGIAPEACIAARRPALRGRVPLDAPRFAGAGRLLRIATQSFRF